MTREVEKVLRPGPVGLRLLVAAAVPVGSVKLSSPTLDEVFLRATGFSLDGASSNGQREVQ